MDLKVTQFEVVMIVSLDEDLTFKMLQCLGYFACVHSVVS